MTPKIHAVGYHAGEFCQLTGRGLCPCSEQTDFDCSKTWEQFSIKNVDNPLYGGHLLRAVSMYNSQHLGFICDYDRFVKNVLLVVSSCINNFGYRRGGGGFSGSITS